MRSATLSALGLKRQVVGVDALHPIGQRQPLLLELEALALRGVAPSPVAFAVLLAAAVDDQLALLHALWALVVRPQL